MTETRLRIANFEMRNGTEQGARASGAEDGSWEMGARSGEVRSQRSEVSDRRQRTAASFIGRYYPAPFNAKLFHQLTGLLTNNRAERNVHDFRVGESFGHIRFQNDHIGSLRVTPCVFTTLALREIVFISHLFT